MANVATIVKHSHILKDEHRALARKLEQLQEDQRHNNYIPAELFRFIDDLRSEVASLRSIVLELSEEKRSRDEKEKQKQKQKNRVVFQFNTLPTDIVMDVTYYPYTLTYNGTYGGSSHSHVTSSAPLSRDRPSQWQVDIISHTGVMLGVIGKNLPATAKNSFSDSSFYAWACGSQVYCAGSQKRGLGSWVAWQLGDRGIFTYDPTASTLALRLLRGGGVTQEFRLDNCVLPQAFIHVIFNSNGNGFPAGAASVRFSSIEVA